MGGTYMTNTTMQDELSDKFGKEYTVASLEKLLKIICCSEIMIEYHLQAEINVLFEIKELTEKHLK